MHAKQRRNEPTRGLNLMLGTPKLLSNEVCANGVQCEFEAHENGVSEPNINLFAILNENRHHPKKPNCWVLITKKLLAQSL